MEKTWFIYSTSTVVELRQQWDMAAAMAAKREDLFNLLSPQVVLNQLAKPPFMLISVYITLAILDLNIAVLFF